jgi:TolA-binding protein
MRTLRIVPDLQALADPSRIARTAGLMVASLAIAVLSTEGRAVAAASGAATAPHGTAKPSPASPAASSTPAPSPASPAASPARTPLQAAIQLFQSGKTKEAKPAFDAILQRDPKNAEAHFYLGRIAFGAQDFDGAADHFQSAANVAPDSSTYHMWIARAYAQKAIKAGNIKRAFLAPTIKKEFEKAVALDPKNLDAHFDLSRFYVLAPGIMGGSVDKAKAQAEEVRKLDPLQGHQCYAMIYEQTKQPELAEKEYAAALRESPDDRKTTFMVGQYYQNHGKFDEAFEIFEKRAKLDPPDAGALYQIGKTALLSGKRLDRGEECLRRYLKGQPGEGEPPLPWAHFRLGQLLEKKGDKPGARAEYAETLRLQPDHEEAKKSLAKLG